MTTSNFVDEQSIVEGLEHSVLNDFTAKPYSLVSVHVWTRAENLKLNQDIECSVKDGEYFMVAKHDIYLP